MQESPAQSATTIETAAVNPKQRQGFAMMGPETLRSVCSQGGRTAHAPGTPLLYREGIASRKEGRSDS